MITGEQLRMVRAMLDWSLKEMEKQTGLTSMTLSNIEKGVSVPSGTSLAKIMRVIEANDIELVEGGVRSSKNKIKTLSGDQWFLELLEDAYKTLKNHNLKEFLIFAGNNAVLPPAVVEGFRKLKNIGVKIREMVKENDTYLMGSEEDYRWIPEEYYQNYVTIVYADKVCNDFGELGLLVQNKEWAETERNKFNLMWHLSEPLNVRSTSDVRY